MHTALLAAACNTGTAWQKYICAHPDMNTPAGHAGFVTGQAMGPLLIGLVIGLIVIALMRRGRSRKPATSS